MITSIIGNHAECKCFVISHRHGATLLKHGADLYILCLFGVVTT